MWKKSGPPTASTSVTAAAPHANGRQSRPGAKASSMLQPMSTASAGNSGRM